jgi:MGT family glycosyltransferase
MSRFLFVVPPLAGHVNPAAAVAQALAGRGHDVAWVGSQARLRPVLGPEATIFPTGMRPYRGALDTGTAAVKSLWEGFVIPFARATLPAVDNAVAAFRPDVVAADQHALAGVLAAQRHGLPWATLAPSTIELARPFRDLPKIEAWIAGQLDALWSVAGLPGEPIDLRFSPYLVIVFTPPALCSCWSFPDHFALVGPAQSDQLPQPDFPWDWLDPRRRQVLVTVGTLAQDVAADSAHFYARIVEALRPLAGRLQGIVVAPAGAVPDPPAHLLVLPRVPQRALMPHLDAVVCHAGVNTVGEALSYGIPLVLAPIRHDQPINAAQVVRAGAGIRVKFSRASPDRLRAAVSEVLEDPAYAQAARRIRDSLATAGGGRAAAQRLERLARSAGSRAER